MMRKFKQQKKETSEKGEQKLTLGESCGVEMQEGREQRVGPGNPGELNLLL